MTLIQLLILLVMLGLVGWFNYRSAIRTARRIGNDLRKVLDRLQERS